MKALARCAGWCGARQVGWLLLALAAALCAPACRAAASSIVEQAYVLDPSGRMSLDEARQQPQQVYNGTLLRGLDDSVVWVRWRLAPAAVSARLVVMPFRSRGMALYDPLQRDAEGQWARLDAPAAEAPFVGQVWVLPPAVEARDLWLRLDPDGPLYLKAKLLSADGAEARELFGRIFMGQIIGAEFMAVLLGVLAWVVDRSGIGRALFIKQLANLSVGLIHDFLTLAPELRGHTALAGITLEPALVDVLRLLNLAVTLWFFVKVLVQLRAARWLLRLAWVPAAGVVLSSLLLLAGQLVAFRLFYVGLVLLVTLGLLFSGLARQREPQASASRLHAARELAGRLGFGVVMAAAWVASFPAGVHQTQDLTYAQMAAPVGMLMAVGVVFLVALRSLRDDRQRLLDDQRRAELAAQALVFERGERVRQQEFMTMLTHELKAPLSTLGLVIGSPLANDSMRRHALLALASMRQVIDHCAQSADIDDASPPLQRQACVLATELELRCAAQAGQSRIRWAPAEALPPVLADPRLLAVIFNNLLDNAQKYAPADAAIDITLVRQPTPEGAVQRVSVSNPVQDGPLPDAARLFQKYYRGEAGQRLSGSGLGLHLSRLLARRQGGDLLYQAQGSTVTFTLVLPEPPAAAGLPL